MNKVQNVIRLARSLLMVFFIINFIEPANCYQLEEAIEDALLMNSSIAASKEQELAAKMQYKGRLAPFLPNVNAYIGIDPTLSNTAAPSPNYPMRLSNPNLRVQVQQNIFNSGGSLASLKKSHNDYKIQQLGTATKLQQIIIAVINSYLSLLKAEEITNLYKESLNAANHTFEDEKHKFSVGETTQAILAKTRTKYFAANAKYIKAQGDEANARANFIHLVKVPPGKLVAPSSLDIKLPSSLEEALIIAKKHNYKLRTAYYNQKSLEFAKAAVLAESLPSIDLLANFASAAKPSSNNNEIQSSIAVTVKIPIFQGGREYTAISGAQHALKQAREQYKEAYKTLEEELTIAWNDYNNALSLIEAGTELVNAYQITLDSLQEEARRSLKTPLEVRDGGVELLKAKIELIEAKNNKIAALYRLITIIYGAEFNLPISNVNNINNKNSNSKVKVENSSSMH